MKGDPITVITITLSHGSQDTQEDVARAIEEKASLLAMRSGIRAQACVDSGEDDGRNP